MTRGSLDWRSIDDSLSSCNVNDWRGHAISDSTEFVTRRWLVKFVKCRSLLGRALPRRQGIPFDQLKIPCHEQNESFTYHHLNVSRIIYASQTQWVTDHVSPWVIYISWTQRVIYAPRTQSITDREPLWVFYISRTQWVMNTKETRNHIWRT